MKYINRDANNKITQVFSRKQNEQQESIDENDPEFLDFQNKMGNYLPSWEARRIEAYGPIGDQLDMLYWDSVNSTTLWEDHISSVKVSIPKE